MITYEKKGIKEVFWTNVLWHAKNKNIPISELMSGKTAAANNKTANIMLERIENIANMLEIDDYAILFEEVEGE